MWSGYGGASTVCCNIDEDLDGVRVTETIMWNLHSQEVGARVLAVVETWLLVTFLPYCSVPALPATLKSPPPHEKARRKHRAGSALKLFLYHCEVASGAETFMLSTSTFLCEISLDNARQTKRVN